MIGFGEIAATVGLAFNVDVAELLGRSTTSEIVQARHVAIWLAHKHTGRPFAEIGPAFGRADHTAVSYALDRINARMANDATFAAAVRALSESIAFRSDMTERDMIDVLPLAKRIYLNPRRDAVRASVNEIVALASSVIDLWDVAVAAERMADLLKQRHGAGGDDVITLDEQLAEIGEAITQTMAALCGNESEEQS